MDAIDWHADFQRAMWRRFRLQQFRPLLLVRCPGPGCERAAVYRAPQGPVLRGVVRVPPGTPDRPPDGRFGEYHLVAEMTRPTYASCRHGIAALGPEEVRRALAHRLSVLFV